MSNARHAGVSILSILPRRNRGKRRMIDPVRSRPIEGVGHGLMRQLLGFDRGWTRRMFDLPVPILEHRERSLDA